MGNSKNQTGWLFWAFVFLTLSEPAFAATYNESISGDLSGLQGSPTPFVLAGGTNSIIGTVGAATGDFQDFVVITVPSGFTLNTYDHTVYTGSDAQGFTGFAFGTTFTGSTFDPAAYLGYAHFGTGATNPGVNGGLPATTVGKNLLLVPYMADNNAGGTAAGAAGFSHPLAAGTYTFLIQQAGGNISYEFALSVAPVVVAQPGDFDGDGDVDGADFVVWQTNFPSAGPGIPPVSGDGDGDGDCDGADFVIWQTNFPYTPSPATVPEPGAIIIGLTGLCAALVFLRRKSG